MIKNQFQLPEIRMIWYAKLNVVCLATASASNLNRMESSIKVDIVMHIETTIANVSMNTYTYVLYINKQRA